MVKRIACIRRSITMFSNRIHFSSKINWTRATKRVRIRAVVPTFVATNRPSNRHVRWLRSRLNISRLEFCNSNEKCSSSSKRCHGWQSAASQRRIPFWWYNHFQMVVRLTHQHKLTISAFSGHLHSHTSTLKLVLGTRHDRVSTLL